MVRKALNRLIGRTGSGTDAINAYVEGNASDDEIKLVEQMMRDNPALEKDLATQQSLLSVLARIARVEAPRSFAITPEMVAAARTSESGILKLAGLFAPQRKLALAPAILAGFAALTVALLTIGDITGVVEQSGRSDSFPTASVVVAESAAPVAGGAPSVSSSAEDSAVSAPELEMAVEAEAAIGAGADGSPELEKSIAAPQAATAAPAAIEAVAIGAAAETAPEIESSAFGDDAEMEAPPSLSAQAPPPAGDEPEISTVDEAPKRTLTDSVDVMEATAIADSESLAHASPVAADDAAVPVDETEIRFVEQPAIGAKNGITLPLWQLQVALAALAAAVIGAWAGLRRVRRD